MGSNGEIENVNKARETLELSQDESEAVSRLVVPAQLPGKWSFYEDFNIRGLRVDRSEPGLVVCSFKVPSRLTDRAGFLARGAIANLVDLLGGAIAYIPDVPRNVSADISISIMSTARLDDELEISSKRLGRKGRYTGTLVLLRNKSTGEIIAEGRHSMFRPHPAAKL